MTTTAERVVQLNQLMYRERIADETLERRLYGIEYADGEPIEVDEVLLVPDVSFREEKLVKGYKKHVYDTAAKRMRVDEIKDAQGNGVWNDVHDAGMYEDRGRPQGVTQTSECPVRKGDWCKPTFLLVNICCKSEFWPALSGWHLWPRWCRGAQCTRGRGRWRIHGE